MGFEAMGRDDYELRDTVVLPLGHELVDGPMQRLTAQASDARVGISAVGNAVRKGRCAQDPERLRHTVRDPLRDKDIGPQWEMRPVLLHGADGENESGLRCQNATDLGPGKGGDRE